MTAVLDADRMLALSYVPAKRREAVRRLWQLDATLGAVLAAGGEPMIRRIKLAWWGEALERLDRAPPPAEPVLQALAEQVLPAGASGAGLAGLAEGWQILLAPDPLGPEELATYANKRGGLLFTFSAKMLGQATLQETETAGEAWALADLARHSGGADACAALDAAKARVDLLADRRWPGPLRPLGMLAALAARDVRRGLGRIEPQGSPSRALRMLKLRAIGR